MKKLVIGMFVLGLTNLACPQSPYNGPKEIQLESITVSPLNADYLLRVKEGTISQRVLRLEGIAARYDLKRSQLYKGNGVGYRISFRQANGKILATYDGKGKILHSYERFNDIAFPATVRNRVYLLYPGWIMKNNTYMVTYTHNKDVEKVYKVRLEKGNLKKNLKISS